MHNRNGINVNISKYILSECPHLSRPIYATYGGYSIYPSAFLSGFAKPTYFSSSSELLANNRAHSAKLRIIEKL